MTLNCNYAVEVAEAIGIKVVNLGGSDIASGNKKLILGLVWQLMRFDTMSLLERLGGGKKVSDSDLIKWANEKVRQLPEHCIYLAPCPTRIFYTPQLSRPSAIS